MTVSRKIIIMAQRQALCFNLYNEATPSLPTFSGAANGTRVNSVGSVATAATPRFDYAPVSLAAKGLLLEEARTNSIRNSTMVGAVAGTPGTLPTNWMENSGAVNINVVGTGTESGMTYIDIQAVGTPDQTFVNIRFDSNTQIAAAQGQTWTGSMYVRKVSGSAANITTLSAIVYERSVEGAELASSMTVLTGLDVASIVANNVTTTRTLASASTGCVNNGINFATTVGQAIDITLRIGLPQLELGAFATSPIPTSGAAVTRTADSATFAWTQAEGTYAVEFDLLAVTGTRPIFSLDDASADNQIRLYANGTSLMLSVTTGGVARDLTLGTVAANTTYKAAFSVFANDVQALMNGGVLQTNFTAAASPIVTTARIGSDQAGNYQNGHSKRIRQWKTRKGLYQLVA